MSGRRYCVVGAPPDTGNLGVTALLTSIVAVLDEIDPSAKIVVFDNSYGAGERILDIGGRERLVETVAARNSRRVHRSSSLARIALTGRRVDTELAGKQALRSADVVLDISGGDSFSDIYGWSRFTQVSLPKVAALRQQQPLILLPQTYGPFRSSAARAIARWLASRATVAISRDPWSYEQLRELLGDDFNESRHLSGIDMAFALPATEGGFDREGWPSQTPVAGINVSGLLYLDPRSSDRFGLASDYRRAIDLAMTALLERTDASIVLTPHVHPGCGSLESDVRANDLVRHSLHRWGDRVQAAPAPVSPSAAKGLIAQMDWFAGSRMHSTIAALSSCVPAAGLAYSPKAQGVFGTAGAEHEVIDLRVHRAEEVADRLVDSYERRDVTAANLRRDVPLLVRATHDQLRRALEIAGVVPNTGDAG